MKETRLFIESGVIDFCPDGEKPYIASGVSPTKDIEGVVSDMLDETQVRISPKREVDKTTSSVVGFLIIVFKTSVTSCISTDTKG